jgi:hypothetical protein
MGVFGSGKADFDGGAFFAHISVGKRGFNGFRLEVPWIGDLNVRVGVMLRIA